MTVASNCEINWSGVAPAEESPAGEGMSTCSALLSGSSEMGSAPDTSLGAEDSNDKSTTRSPLITPANTMASHVTVSNSGAVLNRAIV
jgi:hypothetical protein